jgi:hypothetical protein
MSFLTTPLAPVGLLSIAYMGFLFARFSRRLSAVTKMAYRQCWFWVANVLVFLAAISQAVRGAACLASRDAPAVLLSSWFALLSFSIPLAIGVTLVLVLVWRYWGWILRERIE